MAKKKYKLASYLIAKGLITREQAKEIMAEQDGKRGPIRERFGRIAVRKGYITESQLNRAILEKEREEAGY